MDNQVDWEELKQIYPELYAYLFAPVERDPESDLLYQARQFSRHFAQTHELDPVEDASIIQLLRN